MRRIIRCIRINRDIWERTRNAVKEDKTFISHVIEALLGSYLSNRTWEILMKGISPKQATRKEEDDEHDAKPANKN